MPSSRPNPLREQVHAALQGVDYLAAELGGRVPAEALATRADSKTGRSRPWTVAAAMEPVAPVAPPPTRPNHAASKEPGTSLPAEGGKKMNILPLVVIGSILLLLAGLAEVMVLLLHHA